MTEKHDVLIHFENINEHDVLQFPLAFIKGSVKCNLCSSVLNGSIRLGCASEYPVVDGRFKCLQHLKLGKNYVEMFYQDGFHTASKKLNIDQIPSSCSKAIKLLYLVPNGDVGNFQTEPGVEGSAELACRKIVVGGMLLQTLVAERLREEGFGRKTFTLASNTNHEPVCEIHESSYTRSELQSMSSEEIWSVVAGELLRKETIRKSIKVLAVLSCTEYKGTKEDDFSVVLSNTKAYVACGRGDLCMIGAAGLHSWASSIDEVMKCLTSQESIHSSLMDDSGFRGTMGGCYATTLGSALHELGHALDLVHADTGIMYRGFEDVDLFFSVVGRPKQQLGVQKTGELKVGIQVKPIESSRVSSFTTGRSRRIGKATEGRAFFHRSAAVLLSGHRWLNEDNASWQENENSITLDGAEIRAAGAIRLIELHSGDENLVKYWDFTGNPVRIHRFCLNVCDIRKAGNDVGVLVQDYHGNVMRKKIVLPFN